MIAATIDLLIVVFLGVLAIYGLGVWGRSAAAPRSPKPKLSILGARPSFNPVR
jgi:hypothetical protein